PPCHRPSRSKSRRRAPRLKSGGARRTSQHTVGGRVAWLLYKGYDAAMRAGLAVVVLAACGCNNPTYLKETAPVEATQGTPATTLYVLPVRQPTDLERRALETLQQKLMLPDPVPWAQARDFDIEIQYSVKNLDTQQAKVLVTLDGGNEFGDYVPANYID